MPKKKKIKMIKAGTTVMEERFRGDFLIGRRTFVLENNAPEEEIQGDIQIFRYNEDCPPIMSMKDWIREDERSGPEVSELWLSYTSDEQLRELLKSDKSQRKQEETEE